MNFVSAFELFMGSLSVGLIIVLGNGSISASQNFRDFHYIIENQSCLFVLI